MSRPIRQAGTTGTDLLGAGADRWAGGGSTGSESDARLMRAPLQ